MNPDSELQQRLIALIAEVRDLKTARTIPSTAQFYRDQITLGQGTYTYLKIEVQLANDSTNMDPLIFESGSFFFVMRPFDSSTNKVVFEFIGDVYVAQISSTVTFWSNRPIVSITRTA